MLSDRIREVEEFYGFWDDDGECSTLIGPLDEDCWNKTGHTGPSIAETMRKKGIRWRRSNKNRLLGAAELIGRLMERVPGAVEGEPDRPMIRWMERCQAPIRTLPTLPVDPNDPNLPDTTGDDHCYDESTYMCMWRPLKPRAQDEVDDDDDAPIPISRGRRGRGSGTLGVPPGGWG
jgi:hypothetical protein